LRVGIAVGGRGGSAVAGAVDGGTVGKREVALLVLNSKVHFDDCFVVGISKI
jgi:hypothetical protein